MGGPVTPALDAPATARRGASDADFGSPRAGSDLARSWADPHLDPVRAKIEAGERLSLAEGELLYRTPDVWTVIELADLVRRRLHGDAAYYNINRHLNYSNVCALRCKFCEFKRRRDEPGAYTRSLEEIREEARRAVEAGATEMHIVGGLHPHLPWDYYPDMLRAIADAAPQLHLKAFTAVEIVHLAKVAKVYKRDDRKAGIRWVLERLKEAGLGSLPGGGAEVFDDRVHDEAYKGKIRSDVWLDVHRVAHELGLNTNATILYGHIEQRRERLVHMDMLRRAQDEALGRMQVAKWQSGKVAKWQQPDAAAPAITLTRPGAPLPEHVAFKAPAPDPNHSATLPLCHSATSSATSCGYFQTIIPLPFFPDGSELEALPGPGGLENLRTLAIARLMLDNFPHVKTFWIMQTLPMAQLMLQSGADDIDGTVVWYDITKVGGASTHQEAPLSDLQRAIRQAGFTPIERDTVYRRVERDVRDGRKWRVAE
jgi:CofH subfamily radical SAM domain protein